MNRLECTPLVIFDVETTGLSPATGHRMIEIAAIKISGWQAVDRFHSLIDPEREISYGAYMVNGISQEMLNGAPTARSILPRFLEFIRDSFLIGHNVNFDLRFLRHELALIERELHETIVLDTLKMAKVLLPGLGSYRLWVLARTLGVDSDQRHRAMEDVEMTTAVFQRLVSLARQKNLTDLEIFLNR